MTLAGLQCSWTSLCSFIWYLRYVHTFSMFLLRLGVFTQLQLEFGFQIYCTWDFPLWCCVKSCNVSFNKAFLPTFTKVHYFRHLDKTYMCYEQSIIYLIKKNLSS
jgi:hypothetical protein